MPRSLGKRQSAPPVWGLGWPLPPASPISLPPSYAPRTNAAGGGRGRGRRGLGEQGTSQGVQQAPRAQVGRAIALCSSLTPPTGPLPPASPDLPGLRGTDLVWPPRLLPPWSPYVLPVHFGVPPVSFGVRVPHQRPADALVVGRR